MQQENHRLKNQVEKVLQFAKLDKDDVILQKSEIDIHILLDDLESNMINHMLENFLLQIHVVHF